MTKDNPKISHARDLRTPEPYGRDSWLRRVEALKRIRAALDSSEDEAERYLTDYACTCAPHVWDYKARYTITYPPRSSPAGSRLVQTRPTPEEVFNAIRLGFWREVRRGESVSFLDGNSAIYVGALFLKPVLAQVHMAGRVFDLGDPVLVDGHWRVEIHLSVIRFCAEPLFAFMRADGLLSVDGASGKKSGTLESRYAEELRNHPPSKGVSKAEWARQTAAAHGWNFGTVKNWVSRKENKNLWRVGALHKA